MSSGQLSLKKWIAGWSNDEFPPKKRIVYWVILQNLKKKKRNKSKHMFLSPKKKRKKTWSLNKILKISKCHHDSPAETALKITSRAWEPSRWHAISGWLGLQIRNTGLGICTWPKGRPHEAVNFRHSSWGNSYGKLMETHGKSWNIIYSLFWKSTDGLDVFFVSPFFWMKFASHEPMKLGPPPTIQDQFAAVVLEISPWPI